MSLLESLAIVAAVVTAVTAGVEMIRNYQKRRDAPNIKLRALGQFARDDEWVAEFTIEPRAGSPGWLVARLSPSPLARYGFRAYSYRAAKRRLRSLAFDPPVKSAGFTIPADCPDVVSLRFKICLESDYDTSITVSKRFRPRLGES